MSRVDHIVIVAVFEEVDLVARAGHGRSGRGAVLLMVVDPDLDAFGAGDELGVLIHFAEAEDGFGKVFIAVTAVEVRDVELRFGLYNG